MHFWNHLLRMVAGGCLCTCSIEWHLCICITLQPRAFYFCTWQQDKPKKQQKPNQEIFWTLLHFDWNGPISLCSPLQKHLHPPDIVFLSVCWHKTFRQHGHFFIASRALELSLDLQEIFTFSWAAENILGQGLHSPFQPFSRWARQLPAASITVNASVLLRNAW